ncbi:hypothetical protein M4V62_40580 [Streptomyces durmitorensis]|uniref:Uncharacterized protein n=1 Tax=Streptomyces durmitorensis TaxID=319947 RepID=A0ABY4Q6U1_9ACTN|nr:hypothetical protein [Streptomyces durmitorensis]UQT60867.1 hypothetical protein M4V62_40580 [Streptomyces durmitorensis]
MVRNTPNAADRHLIRIAAASGLELSAARLERWRAAGLIPRPGPDTLIQVGGSRVHPVETAALVLGLLECARHCRAVDDLVLLAFFNGVPVPTQPVRIALAKAFFGTYVQRRDDERAALDSVPAEHRDADPPEYNWAEAAAELDMAHHRDAVRQMRANLKRRRDLATASRAELDARVRGVLIWLNAPALPTHDAVFMADLRSAMAFDAAPERSRAAWLLAALCHSEQRAERRETCGEERLATLLSVPDDELGSLREQVAESLDAMWFMATEGRSRHYAIGSASTARHAGRMLVEWISVRQVHPPGSRPAQVLVDSLRGLWLLVAETCGEGRAAFQQRTRRPGL